MFPDPDDALLSAYLRQPNEMRDLYRRLHLAGGEWQRRVQVLEKANSALRDTANSLRQQLSQRSVHHVSERIRELEKQVVEWHDAFWRLNDDLDEATQKLQVVRGEGAGGENAKALKKENEQLKEEIKHFKSKVEGLRQQRDKAALEGADKLHALSTHHEQLKRKLVERLAKYEPTALAEYGFASHNSQVPREPSAKTNTAVESSPVAAQGSENIQPCPPKAVGTTTRAGGSPPIDKYGGVRADDAVALLINKDAFDRRKEEKLSLEKERTTRLEQARKEAQSEAEKLKVRQLFKDLQAAKSDVPQTPQAPQAGRGRPPTNRNNSYKIEMMAAMQGDEHGPVRGYVAKGAPPSPPPYEPSSTSTATKEQRRLFLGNIPDSVTRKQLNNHFYHYGIEDIRIEDPGPERLPYGFIDIRTQEMAEKAAKELDGIYFYGNKLSVEVAKP